MKDSNTKTLATYQDNFQNYISGTKKVTAEDSFQGQWILSVIHLLPKSAKILEIGSAFGRDAKFIIEKGYRNIELTDAFDASIDYLRDNGLAARKFNAIIDEPEGEYDLIFASAVFLHFTVSELRRVFSNLREHIASSGYLAFSVKLGEGDEWTSHKMHAPRYFHYWQEEDLLALLHESEYEEVDVRRRADGKWLCVTVRVAK